MLERLVLDYHGGKGQNTFAKILEEVQSTVHYKVRQYNLSGYESDDKYQECCIALLKAIEKFNPEGNAKFTTYLSRVLDNHLINLSNSAKIKHQEDEIDTDDELICYFAVDR